MSALDFPTTGLFEGYEYTGDIGVCAVYSRALSNDEVKQNFNSLKTRYGL
jgi:hypothetical protein